MAPGGFLGRLFEIPMVGKGATCLAAAQPGSQIKTEGRLRGNNLEKYHMLVVVQGCVSSLRLPWRPVSVGHTCPGYPIRSRDILASFAAR